MASDIETSRPGNCSPDPTTTKSDGKSAVAAPWRALFFFTTKRSLPILLLGTSTSLIGGIISPATSRVTGKILDIFNQYATGATTPTDFFDRAKTYIIYLVIIAGSAWLIDSLDFAFWLVFGELQAKSSRDRIFRALLKKEMEWYDTQPNGIGALLPRLQAQTRDFQLATAQPLGFLVLALSTITLSLVQACIISWKLTLVTLASAPLIMLLVMWAGRGSQKNLNKQAEQLAVAQKFSTSAFSGIDTVKCFNAQEIEAKKYSKSIHRAAHWYYRVAHANALEMALVVLLSIAMFVQGFYYGSVLIRNKSLSVGDVITTFLSTVNAFISLSAILPQMIVLEKGRAAGAALHAILDARPEKPGKRTGSSCEVPEVCRGDIYFKNVSFAYPSRPQQPVLKNVSMYIPSGDMVFVVGRSGSGKSTLGKLLVKLYSANSGMISIDGRPIDALDTCWLRRNVTLVEQTSHMFNDSVFQNIAVGRAGRRKPRRSKVVEAIGFALLQQVVNDMPQGLDTQLGNRGDGLSGGQRQRMALARARLRDTPILILDESTNALDFISRGLMMDAIRQWRRGKTTIIITHDLAQILPDDYVFVMDQGRMVQEGYRKHMEKLGSTVFQAGAPDDLSGTIVRVDTGNQPVGRPLGSPGLSTDRSSPTAHGPVGGTVLPSRSSTETDYRKSVLSSTALRLVKDSRRDTLSLVPMPLFPPKLNALTRSPPPPPPPTYHESTSNPKSRWSEWVAASGLEIAHQYAKPAMSTRSSSHLMQHIVDRAGTVAVESRAKSSAVIRTRVRPISEGPAHALDPQASDQLETQLSLTKIMRTLWPNLDSTQRLALLGGFWACTLHAVASPVFSYVLSKLIATYIQAATNRHLSLVYSMIMLGLAFADSVATYLYRMLLEYAGQGWVDNVRAEAIKRVLDQPRTFFDEEANSVSRLVDSLDRNGEEMRNLLGRFCGMAYIAFTLVAVSVIWALCAQWKVTLIMLASGTSVGLATKAFAVVSTKWEGLSNSVSEVTSAIFTETFTNIKTVRALTLERHFFEKYTKSTEDALRIGYKRSILSGVFYGLSASVGSFVIALMFYVGAWQVHDGAATVDNVVQVFLQLMFAVTNLGSILNLIPQISSSKDSASRLLRLAQLPRTSHEHRGNVCIETVDDIVFEGLHFSYPSRPEQTVINNLSLRIRPGTCTVIVGGSGSGKSTIANLLLNLYDTTPDSNSLNNKPNPKPPSNQASGIRISNHPLQALSTPNLRSKIALVPQSPTLFPGTIHENISYGLSQSSLSTVVSAAKQAGLHDFIASLPLGYNTIVGPAGGGGVALSGGQVQRIAVARALVREPEVLVLDEATSALDAVSAEKIRRTVRALVGGGGHDGGDRGGRVRKKRRVTVIVITHAREMMEIADRVVVMDEGRIVEEGGFEELKRIEDGALARLLRGGEWMASRECEE